MVYPVYVTVDVFFVCMCALMFTLMYVNVLVSSMSLWGLVCAALGHRHGESVTQL